MSIDKKITIKEYVENMKEGQDTIYYASGSSVEKINSLPQVEQVRDKDYDKITQLAKEITQRV